jgi:WD40 repeat protein
MMFSEDNTKLFMGLHNGNFYVYDTKNWKEVAHWKKNGQVNSICLDNKNEYLFLGGEVDDGLKRINMNKIEQEELNYSEDSRLITSERVFDCEVSDDNHLLGAVSGSGLWLYYNNDNFTKIFNESYKNWGQAVDMSSDLNLLAAGLYNGSIIIYDISSLKDEDRKLYLTGRSIGQRVVYSKLDYLASNIKYIFSGLLLLGVVIYFIYRIKRKKHDESLKE